MNWTLFISPGESVPVTKVSVSSQQSLDEQHRIYSPEKDKVHTLFCGTRVVQTRLSGYDMVKAVVVQTGKIFCNVSKIHSRHS